MWEYSPQSCKKFEFRPEICTSRAFSHKFSMAPSGETSDRIKKSWGWGAKIKRTSSITMRSMVVILGRAPAVDEKV